VAAGDSETITLPASFLEADGFLYSVEETVDGGASQTTLSDSELAVGGNDAEALEITVTNSFASIELEKVSLAAAEGVLEGSSFDYELTATNTGALDLSDVTIVDELPAGVTYSASAGADCSAVGQTVTCTIAGTLAADGGSAIVTITVTVDAAADGSEPVSVINNAKVVGFFGTPGEVDTDVDCSAEGSYDASVSVCAESSADAVLTADPFDESNTPDDGTNSGSGANLPTTGSDSGSLMLTLGALLTGLGIAVLVAGRRPAAD